MVKRKRFLALGALMTALAAGIITVCIQYDLRSFVRMGDGVYDRYAQSLDLSGRQDVDFSKLPRFYNLRQVDLRNTGLTVEQFDWLRGRMPDCEIAWLVPFQGALLDPDTEELTKPLMSAGVISTQLVASAKSVEGYRLMTREWKNGDIVEAVYVSEQAELTEEDVVSASVVRDTVIDDYLVKCYLSSSANRRLTELTRAYKPHGKKNPRDKGRQLAVVVNGRLMTAPVIQVEINGGEFAICGNFSREEAMKLAASLNGKLVVK